MAIGMNDFKKLLDPGLQKHFDSMYRAAHKNPAATALAKRKPPTDLLAGASIDTLRLAWVCKFGYGTVPMEAVQDAEPEYIEMFYRFRSAGLLVHENNFASDSINFRIKEV